MSHRRGFTLVELLVVIGIVGLLLVLAATQMGGMIEQARTEATKATLSKIDSLIEQRTSHLDRRHRDFRRNPRSSDFATQFRAVRGKLDAATNGRLPDTVVDKLATEATWREVYRDALPQRYAETSRFAPPTGFSAGAVTESAECLYLALTGDDVGAGDVGTEFTDSEVRDTDGNGRLEFVDGWGNPVRFYRWPTRIVRPGGGAPTRAFADYLFGRIPGRIDPSTGQPVGPIVTDPMDQRRALPALYKLGLPGFGLADFHDPDTYHAPLVVSPGADGVLGLHEPNDLANVGHLAEPSGTPGDVNDNLTNLNIRPGG